MDQANEFLERCLSGIPDGRYRRRVCGELADHLELLVRDLTEAGLGEEEARAEALQKMGDPEALNREYYAVWERRTRFQRDFEWCVAGGIVGRLSFALFGPLAGAAVYLISLYCPDQISTLILNGSLFGGCYYDWLLYAAAYIPNALFLGWAFRGRRRARTLVAFGLAATRAVETVVMIFCSAAAHYGTDALTLLQRGISDPWFTVPYLIASFAACLALGWVFGGKRPQQGAKETA